VEALGGELVIESAAGQGFRIHAAIPAPVVT
jgi:signal transduction histidine kinase